MGLRRKREHQNIEACGQTPGNAGQQESSVHLSRSPVSFSLFLSPSSTSLSLSLSREHNGDTTRTTQTPLTVKKREREKTHLRTHCCCVGAGKQVGEFATLWPPSLDGTRTRMTGDWNRANSLMVSRSASLASCLDYDFCLTYDMCYRFKHHGPSVN